EESSSGPGALSGVRLNFSAPVLLLSTVVGVLPLRRILGVFQGECSRISLHSTHPRHLMPPPLSAVRRPVRVRAQLVRVPIARSARLWRRGAREMSARQFPPISLFFAAHRAGMTSPLLSCWSC